MTPLNSALRPSMALCTASGVVTPLWAGDTAATQTGGPALQVQELVRICWFSLSGFCSGGLAPGSTTTCVWASNLFTSWSV